MIRIKSNAHSFMLNGKEFQKGTLTVSHDADGVAINGIYAKLEDIECDGEVMPDKESLSEWISDNLFYKGGRDGVNSGSQTVSSATYEGLEPLTNDELETLYPDAVNRFLVVAPNIGSGMLYVKLNMPLMDAWYSWAASPVLVQ